MQGLVVVPGGCERVSPWYVCGLCVVRLWWMVLVGVLWSCRRFGWSTVVAWACVGVELWSLVVDDDVSQPDGLAVLPVDGCIDREETSLMVSGGLPTLLRRGEDGVGGLEAVLEVCLEGVQVLALASLLGAGFLLVRTVVEADLALRVLGASLVSLVLFGVVVGGPCFVLSVVGVAVGSDDELCEEMFVQLPQERAGECFGLFQGLGCDSIWVGLQVDDFSKLCDPRDGILLAHCLAMHVDDLHDDRQECQG